MQASGSAALAEAGLGEMYAELLCKFDPGALLAFLQGADAYRVEAVLPHAQAAGIADAQASSIPMEYDLLKWPLTSDGAAYKPCPSTEHAGHGPGPARLLIGHLTRNMTRRMASQRQLAEALGCRLIKDRHSTLQWGEVPILYYTGFPIGAARGPTCCPTHPDSCTSRCQ